jgi:hypothetical protein
MKSGIFYVVRAEVLQAGQLGEWVSGVESVG